MSTVGLLANSPAPSFSWAGFFSADPFRPSCRRYRPLAAAGGSPWFPRASVPAATCPRGDRPNDHDHSERHAAADQAQEHHGQLLPFVLLHPFHSGLDLAAGNGDGGRLDMETVDVHLDVVLVMSSQQSSWGMSAAGGAGPRRRWAARGLGRGRRARLGAALGNGLAVAWGGFLPCDCASPAGPSGNSPLIRPAGTQVLRCRAARGARASVVLWQRSS